MWSKCQDNCSPSDLGYSAKFPKGHNFPYRRNLKKAWYYGWVAQKNQCIVLVSRQKFVAFAYKHINMPSEFWKKILSSDESKFCIFDIKGRKIAWRKFGTALNKEKIPPTVTQEEEINDVGTYVDVPEPFLIKNLIWNIRLPCFFNVNKISYIGSLSYVG